MFQLQIVGYKQKWGCKNTHFLVIQYDKYTITMGYDSYDQWMLMGCDQH